MFNLTDEELQSNSFLDCPAGACSFTAESFRRNINATALDCEYGNSPADFEAKCRIGLEKIKIGFSGAEDLFDWSYYGDLDHLLTYRQKAARLFLEDYQQRPSHYVQGNLPNLGLPDNQFDFVLSGHFLFLYADRLDFEFHLDAILELLRVAKKEVRIYPLIGLNGSHYTGMDDLLEKISKTGHVAQLQPINFQFLKGSSQMLSIKKFAG